MKKNIVTIVLAVLVVMFGLNSLHQMVKANQEAERARLAEADAVEQKDHMVLAQVVADEQRAIAEAQTKIAIAQRIRAESLQQLLDKCK